MRIEGKPRPVKSLRTGKMIWSQFAATKEEAEREDVSKYWPQVECPVHGSWPVVYVKTGLRKCCAGEIAIRDYHAAKAAGEPTDLGKAYEMGLDYYWARDVPIEYCGHSSKVTLRGKCYECQKNKKPSPRQQAIADGKVWYDPDTPCSEGHMAPRRVSNGSCHECEKEDRGGRVDGRTVPIDEISHALMTDYPDMILSRKDAKAGGFLYFRTGKPCCFGHNGWRYTSTGGCMICRKSGPHTEGVK